MRGSTGGLNFALAGFHAAYRDVQVPGSIGTTVNGQQTFVGTAQLMVATGDEPAELRRKVTSPKGTTERIVAVLDDADLASIFDRAAAAAITRAEELSAGS